MSGARGPCIIGVAQRTIHPDEGEAPEPLDLWVEMAQAAATDSGGHDVLQAIDDVNVVYSLSWNYDDAPARLAESLKLGEGGRHLSGMSGTSSQKMLCNAADRILAGEVDLALVVGAESLATRRRMKKAGVRPAWSYPPAEKPRIPFDTPFHPSELSHEVLQAYLTFATFDVARRAHLNLSIDENINQIGEIFGRMTEVAAENSYAWFRSKRTASELISVAEQNRMVAHPYTKNLVAIMDVDMASGLLIASDEKADALGVPKDRRVYLRGFCEARDPLYVAEREDLWRSRAMEATSRIAMESAGIGIDEIAYFDLYSCFPSSVNFARDALKLAVDDPRPLTVTGGLPYQGGPGSGYVGHAIAALVEKLRADPNAYGMASGVGMHMVNHSYAVYSARPGSLILPDQQSVQATLDSLPKKPIRNRAEGSARIASYSVVHGREGPRFGVAVCDLPAGDRAYARSEDEVLMRDFESREWVGRDVELSDAGNGVNRMEA